VKSNARPDLATSLQRVAEYAAAETAARTPLQSYVPRTHAACPAYGHLGRARCGKRRRDGSIVLADRPSEITCRRCRQLEAECGRGARAR
jgi:hypothetical protein